MNRLFLYSGFLFILILIFDAYDRDYNQPKTDITQSETIGSINESAKKPPQDNTINKTPLGGTEQSIQTEIRSLENNKLFINFDAKSGELLFDPYIIFKRGELKIGVIGATDLIPDTMKSIQSSDFIESCNRFAKELKDKVDIVVVLVNASRSTQNGLPEKMPNVDFIITSGNTSMSRTNSPQKENGPFLYSCGKQGKYFLTLTLDIKEKGVSFVDVSAEEKKVKSVQKRFDRLQKKDPDKNLEEIYADQENVLNLIKKYREDLKISEQVISSAINTLQYQTNPLNNKIGDDAELLAFVTSSVKTCDALAPKKKPVNQNKNKNNRHKGHDH